MNANETERRDIMDADTINRAADTLEERRASNTLIRQLRRIADNINPPPKPKP